MLVIDRIRATSFITRATRGKWWATWIPGTAVSMALVSPPVSVPGLGSQVSSWLGPPPIQSRMQAICRFRSSSAWTAIRSVKLRPASPAAPRPIPRRNDRRPTTPWPPIATLRMLDSNMVDAPVAERMGRDRRIVTVGPGSSGFEPRSATAEELGRVDQGPEDVLERLAAVADVLEVVRAGRDLPVGSGVRPRARR